MTSEEYLHYYNVAAWNPKFLIKILSHLDYDTSYLLCKGDMDLPEKITSIGCVSHVIGTISAFGSKIRTVGNLKRVDGSLILEDCMNLITLHPLKHIKNDLYLDNSGIKSLSTLKYIGGDLHIENTSISALANDYKKDDLISILTSKHEIHGNVYL